jgi:hypothetical protein
MPAATATKLDTDSIRHEDFCLPRPSEKEPRLEGFIAYEDDARTGRTRPAAFVTRCLECGAASYKRQTD